MAPRPLPVVLIDVIRLMRDQLITIADTTSDPAAANYARACVQQADTRIVFAASLVPEATQQITHEAENVIPFPSSDTSVWSA